ncbi:S41 family peptidase [Dysgonomonas macrotermitis]|uniref:C-terminal processing protease CtpA/Prc, contains a PDZ domain n=1 Tax=Dysgonomonas macrotermitis TaxID=1346286 RepID=A0A1M4T9N1_9BACT|nr:S41 family peptidase [Dysgonomonas macrotermitis]SHE41171.1 C-terminal processing protease CtpA/Prc, contains a PDZ domain [Dysgonomonas macrotermitis]
MRQTKTLFFIILSVAFCLFSSCSDDDKDNGSSLTDNEYVNNWIYTQMNEWYLWNANMPTSPNADITPDVFFENLLYQQEDRFSFAVSNYSELIDWTNNVSTDVGFEYYTIVDDNNIPQYYIIVYVKPDTDAQTKGLQRGDKISAVNGVSLTSDNYSTLLNGASSYALTIEGKAEAVSINTMTNYPENPILYSNIYTEGSKKIGYLVYNAFTQDNGDGSGDYDAALMAKLQEFYDANITDLVLDLRYNGGGLVQSAQYLASGLVKNRDSKNIFVKNEYNANITEEINQMSSSRQDEWLYSYFLDKYTINRKSVSIPRLGDKISKVYILTGKYTASASELIINGLKPYMDVELIGRTTYGKNVASISLYEEKDSRNKWGLQPIIMKMYNNDNQSDYTQGFTPTIEINEFGYEMKQLGDTEEILLKTAIEQISGTQSPALRALPLKQDGISPAARRKGALDMFIDNSRIKELSRNIQ